MDVPCLKSTSYRRTGITILIIIFCCKLPVACFRLRWAINSSSLASVGHRSVMEGCGEMNQSLLANLAPQCLSHLIHLHDHLPLPCRFRDVPRSSFQRAVKPSKSLQILFLIHEQSSLSIILYHK